MKQPRTLWDEVFEFSLAAVIVFLVGWMEIGKLLAGRKSGMVGYIRGR